MKSAVVVGAATILSRVLGLGRETTITGILPTGTTTDALYMAILMPELIRYLVLSGIMNAIFIPLFAEAAAEKGLPAAKHMAGQFLTFSLLVGVVTALLGSVGAAQVIHLSLAITPPVGESAAELVPLAISLTRVAFPIMIFTGLSGVIQGILNSLHDYRTPAWAPLWFNVVFIVVMVTIARVAPHLATAHVMAGVIVLGAAVQVLVQLPALRRQGVVWLWPVWKEPVWWKFASLLPAAFIGYSALITNNFVDRSFAFSMGPVVLTALWLAIRVQQLPTGVFSITLVTALFPTVAQKISQGLMTEASEDLYLGIRLCALTLLPCTAFLWVWSVPVIRLLFNHGEFAENPEALPITAQALAIYGLALFSTGAGIFATRTLFALRDRRTPVILGLLTIALNYASDYVLAFVFDLRLVGIALSSLIVTTVSLVASLYVLARAFPLIRGWLWRKETGRVVLLSALYALFCVVLARGAEALAPVIRSSRGDTPFATDFTYLFIVGVLSIGFLFGGALLLGLEEMQVLVRIIKRKRGGGSGEATTEGAPPDAGVGL